jgi:hypothetical protein
MSPSGSLMRNRPWSIRLHRRKDFPWSPLHLVFLLTRS